MKSFIIKNVAILIFSLIFISCEQSNPVYNNSSDFGHYTLYSTNPLEAIGIEHNIILTEFTRLAKISELNGEFENMTYPSIPFKSKMASLMNTTYHNVYPGSNTTELTWSNLYTIMNIDSYFQANGDVSFMFLEAESILSLHATLKDYNYTMDFLNDISELLDSPDSTLDVLVEMQSIVASHEQAILSESWGSNETFALGTIAVAKHTCQFWIDYYIQNPSSKVDIKNYDLPVLLANKKLYKGTVAAADMIGAIVGSIKGATIGSGICPGAGTLVGYYAGKVAGGALTSSAALGIFGVIDFWKRIND